LYGVDYSTIICRYDANGGRIFRGFGCRTSRGEDKTQERTANTATNADSKNSAAQAALALVGKVTVSPNPTEGQVNIAFENLPPKGAVLYLTDAKAMLIHEIEVVDTNTTLSLSSLPSGVCSRLQRQGIVANKSGKNINSFFSKSLLKYEQLFKNYPYFCSV
jgi:hypothetical protein